MQIFSVQGKSFVIYSDYPVKEKLSALGLCPDYSFWSDDGVINCMKPNSRGLEVIIFLLGTGRSEILYVGDRYDRDGLCASGAGIDYMDVRDFMKKFQEE